MSAAHPEEPRERTAREFEEKNGRVPTRKEIAAVWNQEIRAEGKERRRIKNKARKEAAKKEARDAGQRGCCEEGPVRRPRHLLEGICAD